MDSSILIRHWRKCLHDAGGHISNNLVEKWAQALIDIRETNAIVTPVYVELVAGTTHNKELTHLRHFLACFKSIDKYLISAIDWRETIRLAERIPRSGKPRQLGDCLIAAVARRLNCEVVTLDQGFP